jgi:hypothetical protein
MSQSSTGLSRHERGCGNSEGSKPTDFALDSVHRWKDWCAMVGVHPVTGWRWVKAGNGPIITNLSSKLIGVQHRHHLAWLKAREQHNHEAA